MRKALVIGVDDYPNTKKLTGCVTDATRIAKLLELHGNGTTNFDVKLITSLTTSVSRPVLREAVAKLFAGDPEVALLYFSGHGVVSSTGGYLATVDGRKFDEGVSMDEVLNLANRSRAKNKMVILDCCHSGAMANPALAGSSTALLADGLTVMTASLGDELAEESPRGGVFSTLVAEGLERGAADLRGNVTPGSLYAYVDQALGAWEQRPMFKANVSGLCTLRQIPPKVPLEKLRRIASIFDTADAPYRLSPEHEFTVPGHDPVKVEVFQFLQQLVGLNLVEPVDEKHMYFAAMKNKSCRLTAAGHQYWRLAKEGKL